MRLAKTLYTTLVRNTEQPPSEHVEDGGPYVTLISDGIIKCLAPNRLPPNVTNTSPKPGAFDHEFIKHYLNGELAGSRIIENTLSQIKKLADAAQRRREPPTKNCVKWFNEGTAPKEKDYDSCWATCCSQMANMGTFECPAQCEIICGC